MIVISGSDNVNDSVSDSYSGSDNVNDSVSDSYSSE